MAKKHARYSPSALDSLSMCPRFKYWNKYEGKGDDAGSEGEMLHAAFEHENLTGLDDEQQTSVQKCIDYKNSLLASEGGPQMWTVYQERKWTLEDRTFGYADWVAFHKEKHIVHVMDAKFVRRDDEHKFQVRTYGAAAYEEFYDGKVVNVTTHVVAPRIGVLDVDEYVGLELYNEVIAEIDALYEVIDDPFNPPTPNEDLCEKCARASRCPAMGNAMKIVAENTGLPVPATFAPDAMVSGRDRAIGHILAGAMIAWADQVKKNNNNFAKEGGEVPGFSLRSRSTGYRAASDSTDAIITALKASGERDDTIHEACTFSLSKFAKNAASMSDKTEAECKEDLLGLIGDYLSEGSTSYLQKSKRIKDVEALKVAVALPA
jgi:hypothetical protein